ncbi:helix-turn-helix domain-containing protein [Roseobacteraceae bacterium S113]
MARDILTGTRIRERRSALGLKQAELAQQAGISASYLNLIEHNRRRIGGKLLLSIAQILDVDPTSLTEGAEAELIAALRRAADTAARAEPELERTDEFAGRFPGWARLVAEQSARVDALEHNVAALTNRLAHDPQLAAALHDILSTVTAIRSTAGILAEDAEISPEWRGRFHRNINEEAARLSDSSTELVRYLEAEDNAGPATPQEEIEAYLGTRSFRLPELETGAQSQIEVVLEQTQVSSKSARGLLQRYLARYWRDAQRLPFETLADARLGVGDDPAALAARLDVPLESVLHRLALVDGASEDARAGLVICDAAGQVLYRKPLDPAPLPQFGAQSTLWPLYAALGQPGQPLRRVVVQTGREERRLEALCIATPVGAPVFDVAPRLEAIMLIRPTDAPTDAAVSTLPIGAL